MTTNPIILEGRIEIGPNSKRCDLIAIYQDGSILGQACFPGMESAPGSQRRLEVLPGETVRQAGIRYLRSLGADIRDLGRGTP